jgi:glycosyltransferase involved in cell wall biosynthesis
MAAHNESMFIEQCINSIRNQTFKFWNLIVIDDGSTDNTSEIVQSIASYDKRIILLKNDINIGLPQSLNRGIKASQTPYIARADADDWYMPERLMKQYKFLVANQNIDIVGTGAILVDLKDNPIGQSHRPSTHDNLSKFRPYQTPFIHPSVMMRQTFFDKVGLYNPDYIRAQDLELWQRGFSQGCSYANLGEPLMYYRTHEYKQSWASIYQRARSLVFITKKYGRPSELFYNLFISFVSVLVKLNLYTPQRLRRRKLHK